ncbi:MAG: succinylglutamate desuccinylase/aspartoacylase family protein [Halioglobus sp.]|nr:succinylglutamate desuccinylase/aspartoacylase family protein [Halioglobus sp.]
MRRHQVFGSWGYPAWLFTVLVLIALQATAQVEPSSQPDPAAPSEQLQAPSPATPQPGARPAERAVPAPDAAAKPVEAKPAPQASKQAQRNSSASGDTVAPTPPNEDATPGQPAQQAQPSGSDKLQPVQVLARKLTVAPATPERPAQSGKKKADQTLEILGTRVAPGESDRLLWIAGETTYGSKLETPVYVIRGKHPGPTLCLTAAIHGDELNGVEIIRSLVSDLAPKKLYGTVIGVPIVNLLGFTRGTRYLPDRRDLNRYFPGNPNGSSASRIAFSFFENIVRHCDLLIDLHTGSLTRTNMPQVRANLQIPEVLEFTTKFGSTAVLHSGKLRGNLRSAATNYGIPAVALELGEPGSLQEEHVEEGVEIIETVLSGLNMTRKLWTVGGSQPVFYSSRWVRVNTGGLLISKVDVGERVWEGAVLGAMVNPITNESFDVISPYSGRVLGMALNQFMLPGYAAFNIGIVADKEGAADDAQSYECVNTGMDPEQVSEEFGCSSGDDEEIREDIELGIMESEEGS